MDEIGKDIRFSLKLLTKQKGFTAAAVLTLALCIGANTAMFSVVNSVLLEPLPFPDADRVVRIFSSYPGAGVERGSNAAPDYYDRLEGAPAFESIAMYAVQGMTIGETGRPERVTGLATTPSLFDVLRVSAALGRTFTAEEGEPGAGRVAVLSHGLWQEQYGGAADVIGRTVRVNDSEHTIVGVMPREFTFEDPAVRLWVPLSFTPEMRADDRRHNNNWESVARLKPGMTIAHADAQLAAINARVEERLPEVRDAVRKAGYRTVVTDYRSDLTRDVRGTLLLLQGGVLLVLLIGCVNVANLVLVRATARQRELATRAALGAARGRLVRQLLTESVVLALLGGAAGVLLGWGGVRVFAATLAGQLPRGTEVVLDATTLLATGAAALVAGLLFGILPAARLLRADLSSVFRDEGRTGTASRSTHAWRGGLVVAQVSLACALLIGAGLLVASFARTVAVQPGFTADHLLTAAVALPVTRYPDAAARRQFADRVLERVRALPGVQYAGATNVMLFGGNYNSSVVTPEGYVPRPDDRFIVPVNSYVSDGYFEAMGIALRAGRTFTARDVDGNERVAVIDQTLADRLWPGQDPLDRRLTQGIPGIGFDDDIVYHRVVGVVRDARAASLAGDQPTGHYYTPLAQNPVGRIYLTVRTVTEPTSLSNALRGAVTEIDADLPVFDIRTMGERIAASLTAERVRMLLLVAFGALALFLAAVGLYGVLAYSVAQRSAEIGIRLALGSSAAAVFRLVLAQGTRLLAAGLTLGVAASLLLNRLVRSMLYGVQPFDPLVYSAVLAVLGVTALGACLVPARRAMRVEPMTALRE
jgi:putative ABC transport system permease protein